ncbi:hypothetical protein CBR_g44597 [Chara braunii]|uniref:Reverse transcriptase domain-containing protein n=1 Tax=Chara braunii TaxID=69332 RepID=A0A388LXT4_CHABU|nr:hypothetical protein CBR_g44597 [Chara braunii]|eukprot:GBG87140.1 hypothetical protein CBR_g44597 [Chara braunii]
MATEDETRNHESEGGPGLGGSVEQSKEGQKYRESTNPDGTKGNRKEMSSGESSGKAGGSRQGTQENKEGRNKDRASPGNSEGALSKKVRVTNARRKLAEIEKRTAEYKARLIEEMMIGNEEGPLQEVPRDKRKTSRGGTGQGDKGSDRGGTPSKRRKERENSPGMEAEKATNPLAIDSRVSCLLVSPAVSRGCEGLWSLRERVLGWFDPEGTAKTRGGQEASKEGPDTSMACEASSSEGGLRKIVSSLARALNKNQGYLAYAKKKITFDGANITEFLIDYENLAALLKWTEEEKMDHLGQHVSLSLGRDIMAIVAANRSWKETRDVMMRKYLAAEKMATEVDLAAVQRKNFATYNDFLREFTLVALRIPGVTDQIMSKYFLRQFSEFDKDKILSAYQQTSKFVNTRDVDFSTVTDLAEKTVVTETLALLKEGEIIDLTSRTGDKAGLEAEEPEKVYGKPREEEPTDKVTAAKKKFRYQIPILSMSEIDDTLGKLLGTMVSVSFQTMLQASPRLLKGLRQLLTRRWVEIDENPELPEEEREEEPPQEVANLQRSRGDLEDLEKALADVRLSLPDREGGEVMRAPPGTKLSFHALPVGKLKVQIGTRHTDALVDGGTEITLIRKDFATVTGCTVNKEVTGSIRGAGGEIPFAGYVTKCAVKAGVRESIWSFQRMTIMEEMDHDIILGRPWCANVEMIGMHLHDGTYMVDIEDPVTGRGELLRFLGTGGDPPKEKMATWSPSFEDSARKGAFTRMEVFSHESKKQRGQSRPFIFRKKIPKGSVRKYKPVGKKAKPVSILLETSKEEAMEKEEEVLQVIRERRATEGHRIPDEVVDTMKIGINGFLTEEENRLIKKTCQEFHLAFAFSDHQKGRLDAKLIPPVRIHTVEHECWNDKGPSYEFGIAGEVTDLLRAKMDSFVAEPTTSPYANRWFVFRNPNKTLRWIQDLQKMNAVTIRDAGSLPQADLFAESHVGRSIYSLIDLYSGYDQLPLDIRDRPYTSMHTPVGQLQMQVTPMGFTNAVAEAQRRMLVVVGDMFPEKCEPYIDDNPIKGAQEKDETKVQPGIRKFVWDNLQDIKDLLCRFLVYNITASGQKSILAVQEVTILGFC